MIIRTKAPVRISFGSSGDSNYYLQYVEKANGLNATINRYSYTELHPRKDDKIVLRSLETGQVAEFDSPESITFEKRELNLMKAVVKHFGNKGVEIITWTDAPLDSGLGGSAAHAVSLIKAFCEYNNTQMTNEEIARLAYHLERNVLGIEGGYQDQWAASYGGINYLQFLPEGNPHSVQVVLNQVRLREMDLKELEASLLLVHLPRERTGREVHLEQRDRSRESIAILNMKYNVIENIRTCLEEGRFEQLGYYLNLDWKIKKQLAPSITNPIVDEIYETALMAGATGGRVIGAGSGGSMLLCCGNRKSNVMKALEEKFGVKEIKFEFERPEAKTDLSQAIHEKLREHQKIIEEMLNSEEAKRTIETIAHKIVESYRHGGKLIIFGNGGSAADAQHIVGELVNKMNIDRPMLNAIALTVNTSVLTAIANDSNYDDVFEKQIESLAEHKDVVIGMSTSGKAVNVAKALKKAKERGAYVVYFTGKTGGKISEELEKDIIDVALKIPSMYTPRIQEAHILAGHIICELVEQQLYG